MKLLFKQRVFSWFDSYDIYDEQGKPVFAVNANELKVVIVIEKCDSVLSRDLTEASDLVDGFGEILSPRTALGSYVGNCDKFATDGAVIREAFFGIGDHVVERNVCGYGNETECIENAADIIGRITEKTCELNSVVSHFLNLF